LWDLFARPDNKSQVKNILKITDIPLKTSSRCLIRLACIGAIATVGAHAATIVVILDSNWADYHQYSYTATDQSSQTVPTGPYIGTFTGGSFGSSTTYLFCLDFNIDTSIGQPYSGYLVHPTTQADIESAYLENKVLQAGGYNSDVQSLSGPVSMAIWTLEDPSSANPAPFPVDPTTAALVTEAQNAYLNGTWTASMAAAFPMWIPDTIGSSQRFGVMLGPQFSTTDIVPEPGSASLFVIAGLLFFASRKLHSIRTRAKDVA
jgi:hypothetical protein